MMSSGMALMAADSTVIAKPAWIQIITTIRSRVFHGALSSNCCGSCRRAPDSWLSRPIWLDALLVGAVLVDELPDDRRADERDRHRQEDQRLGERLEPGPVDQDRVDQADRGGHERRDQDDPEDGVAQHRLSWSLSVKIVV